MEDTKCEYCGGSHPYTQCPQIMRFEYAPVRGTDGQFMNVLASVTKRPMAEMLLFQYMNLLDEEKQKEVLEKCLIPRMLG